jgi:Flp pilus assembly CpaE family ATPase
MVLWITSSDFSSINNSLVALETLQQLSYPDARVRLMLNITSVDDGVRPAKIEEVLGRQFFWLVPYDRQLRLGGQIGKPVVGTHRDSRGAQSIIQLAQALMGVGPKATVKPSSSLRRRFFTRREESNGYVPPAAPREKVIGSAETN